uniref:G-protein coupled receptors family 1 profile domain-containing protein n=1 Tax=Lates calcarifer TaxID=8187 RepID=A0A4W6C663_LATCA
MENQTVVADILILEGLKVSPQSSIPAFIFLLLTFIFIIRSLHQPMYLLLCNMTLNDVFGATASSLMSSRDLLLSDSERYIHYMDCVVQAFFMVVILLGLSVRLSRCRSVIFNLFCDNASLFKLSCESVLINNIYGLTYTVVLLGSSICSITLTYLRIAAVCLRGKNKALNSKALQTCATHLAVYLILLKVASVLGHVVLPALNAVIYGLQIKEIRQRIIWKSVHIFLHESC